MRRLLGLLAVCAGLSRLAAAPPFADNVPTKAVPLKAFWIPISVDNPNSKLTDLEVYVWPPDGTQWELRNTIPATRRGVEFRAGPDGVYLFALRGIYAGGTAQPASLQDLRPMMKAIVDTVKPAVKLQSLPSPPGTMGVSWTVKDAGRLDPRSFRLEYRPAGSTEAYQPLQAEGADIRNGQQAWNFNGLRSVEIRLSVRDEAGNVGADALQVSLEGAVKSIQPGDIGRTADATPFIANRKAINLTFTPDIGKSEIVLLDLWYTTNRQDWQKYNNPNGMPRLTGDGGPTRAKVPFVAPTDGLYGFTLVIQNKAGLGDPQPKAGDEPRTWVLIDSTPPTIDGLEATAGKGELVRQVTIRWRASDANFNREPICLEYADNPSGPWFPIATTWANSGQYLWEAPDKQPYSFYVKIRATDRAGNFTEKVTTQPVIVDSKVPRADIVGVEPAEPR